MAGGTDCVLCGRINGRGAATIPAEWRGRLGGKQGAKTLKGKQIAAGSAVSMLDAPAKEALNFCTFGVPSWLDWEVVGD